MRILHIISRLDIGGAEKLISDLIPIMSENRDIEVNLIVFETCDSIFENKLRESGIEIINLNVKTRSPKAVFKLRKHIKNSDLVHVHLFPALYFAAIANIGLGKKLFYTEHSTHNKRRNHKWLRPLEKYIYKCYDKVICISEATSQSLNSWIGEKTLLSRLEVIENGIDISIYDKASTHASVDMFGRDGIPVLMISRFTPAKDHATVLKALTHIDDPKVFIAFAGDGPTRESIENMATELGVEDRVVFLGNRNDIPELIKSARVGVQSSNWEGFGLTAIEMMAGKLPVVASDVEGLKKVVENAGLLFEKGNHKQLSKRIMEILNDEILREKLIAQGSEKCKIYSIHSTTDKYLNLSKKQL